MKIRGIKKRHIVILIVLLLIIGIAITIKYIEVKTNKSLGFSFGEPRYSPGRDVDIIINTQYGKIYLVP